VGEEVGSRDDRDNQEGHHTGQAVIPPLANQKEEAQVNSIPFVPLLALGTLVFTVVNFLKFVKAKDWNAAVTQGIAWIAGVVVVALFAQTQFAEQLRVGTLRFSQMTFATQLFFGLIATSLLSTLNEFKKAIDNTDTAGTPSLIPGTKSVVRKRAVTRTEAGQSVLLVVLIVLIILCFGLGFAVKWLFIVAIALLVAALLEALVWHPRSRR
jgi:hypothetical protein